MNEVNVVVIAAVVAALSSVITSVITILLTQFFEDRRDKSKQNQELKLLKQQMTMSVDTEIEKEIRKLKLEALPKMVSHVYRCRNIAREIVAQMPNISREDKTRFVEAVNLMNDDLEEYRFALGVKTEFALLHELKTTTLPFLATLDDFRDVRQSNNTQALRLEKKGEELKAYYARINSIYEMLMENIFGRPLPKTAISIELQKHERQ